MAQMASEGLLRDIMGKRQGVPGEQQVNGSTIFINSCSQVAAEGPDTVQNLNREGFGATAFLEDLPAFVPTPK